jgi:hypothetical protein
MRLNNHHDEQVTIRPTAARFTTTLQANTLAIFNTRRDTNLDLPRATLDAPPLARFTWIIDALAPSSA